MSMLPTIFIAKHFPFWALVRRDLLRTLRQKKSFLWILLLVGFASVILAAEWPCAGYSVLDAAGLSRQVVEMSAILWLFAAWIVIPGHAAGSIALEREQETHELVSTTLISPTGFVLAKILNVLGLYGILLLGSLPVYACAFFLVGTDVRAIVAVAVMIASTALCCAAVGTLCSALSRRLLSALVTTYLVTGLAMGGGFLVILFFGDATNFHALERVLQGIVKNTSPLTTVGLLRDGLTKDFVNTLCFQFAITVFSLYATVWVIRREARLHALTSRGSRAWNLVRGFFVWETQSFRPIADGASPIFEREVRWEGMSRPFMRRILFLLSLIVWIPTVLVYPCRFTYGWDWRLAAWMGTGFTMVALTAPLVSATALTREEELHRKDSLRVTLVGPGAVLLGKWRSAWTALFPVLAVITFSSLLLTYKTHTACRFGFSLHLTGLTSTFACAWVAINLGILVSSLTKRTPSALSLAHVSTAFLFLLLAPVGLMAHELSRRIFSGLIPTSSHPITHILQEAFFFVMPSASVFENLDRQRDLPGNTLFTPYWAGSMLFCFAYGSAFLALAWWRVKRMWRASS